MKQIVFIAGVLLLGLSSPAKAQCWPEPDGSYCCGDRRGELICRPPRCAGHQCLLTPEDAALEDNLPEIQQSSDRGQEECKTSCSRIHDGSSRCCTVCNDGFQSCTDR